jgi:hypothetical protein
MTRPGRKLSEEHREKLRQAALRRYRDPEERAKTSAAVSRPDVQGPRITKIRERNEREKGPRWIEDENGCWLWQWGTSATGYPSQGQRRAIYLLRRGPCPRDMQLHHHCATRLCVNPDHQVPLPRMQHAGLHAILRRRDWMDLPVPERIALSRSIIERELALVP